jgi:hypothetical protein
MRSARPTAIAPSPKPSTRGEAPNRNARPAASLRPPARLRPPLRPLLTGASPSQFCTHARAAPPLASAFAQARSACSLAAACGRASPAVTAAADGRHSIQISPPARGRHGGRSLRPSRKCAWPAASLRPAAGLRPPLRPLLTGASPSQFCTHARAARALASAFAQARSACSLAAACGGAAPAVTAAAAARSSTRACRSRDDIRQTARAGVLEARQQLNQPGRSAQAAGHGRKGRKLYFHGDCVASLLLHRRDVMRALAFSRVSQPHPASLDVPILRPAPARCRALRERKRNFGSPAWRSPQNSACRLPAHPRRKEDGHEAAEAAKFADKGVSHDVFRLAQQPV